MFSLSSNVYSHALVVYLFFSVCGVFGEGIGNSRSFGLREHKRFVSALTERQLWLLEGEQGARGSLIVASHTHSIPSFVTVKITHFQNL